MYSSYRRPVIGFTRAAVDKSRRWERLKRFGRYCRAGFVARKSASVYNLRAAYSAPSTHETSVGRQSRDLFDVRAQPDAVDQVIFHRPRSFPEDITQVARIFHRPAAIAAVSVHFDRSIVRALSIRGTGTARVIGLFRYHRILYGRTRKTIFVYVVINRNDVADDTFYTYPG